MSTPPGNSKSRNWRDTGTDPDEIIYELTLFVNGASDLAGRAVSHARRLCELHCGGRVHLSIVDIHDDPDHAVTKDGLATPTLVRSLPAPMRRVVGDLSHSDSVLAKLGLPAASNVQIASVG